MGRIHLRNSTQFLFQVVLCWLITILCNNATIVLLQVAFTFCLLNYGKKLIAQTIKLVSSVTSLNLEVHSYYVRTRKIDLSLSPPIFERWTSLKMFSYLLLMVVDLFQWLYWINNSRFVIRGSKHSRSNILHETTNHKSW